MVMRKGGFIASRQTTSNNKTTNTRRVQIRVGFKNEMVRAKGRMGGGYKGVSILIRRGLSSILVFL